MSPPSRYRLALHGSGLSKNLVTQSLQGTGHLKEGPLDDFHVVILPDGGDYERYLDKRCREN